LERIIKLFQTGNFLLAAYTTDYTVIREALRHSFDEAANFFIDVKYGKLTTVLSNLSEMQLLSVVRNIMYTNYSYEFFGKALDQLLGEVLGENDRSEKAAIYCFLLAAACLDTTGINMLEEIAAEFKAGLPMSLRLAIGHEVQDKSKEKTKVPEALKKFEKNIRRHFTGSTSARATLDSFYQKPLRLTVGSDKKRGEKTK
jgi:hypothetical protein